ncbi:MAG: DRTGG domain-containing protein [Chloroflexota bacterium]
MVALCVASPAGQVGKTALCAGIGRRLQNDGKRIGFFKPISIITEPKTPGATDRDSAFLKETLELHEPLELVCPLRMTSAELQASTKTSKSDIVTKIQNAYREVVRAKDVVVIEGPSGLSRDSAGASLLADILGTTEAWMLIVLQYSGGPWKAELGSMDSSLKAKLLGAVVNGVPANKMAEKAKLTSGLDAQVFGVLPQDRTLLGLSVKELGEIVGAVEVTPADGTGELVENIMLGAAGLDPGPQYFGRKSNKAVIVRGERSDMQLAAMETPTRCLVLTGGVKPIDAVLRQAERRKVPILVTEQDTRTAMSRLEQALSKVTFSHEQKLRKFDELVSQHFDFKALYKALGI